MKYALLFIGFSLISTLVYAQTSTDGVYAAPGMSVKLPHRLSPSSPARHSAAAPKPVSTRIAVISPILPRFWRLADTARSSAVRRLYDFASSQIKYPHNTLRAGIDGTVYARLTLSAGGTVSQASITRRELHEQGGDNTYSEKGKAALDAEVLRVLQALRFQPSGAANDTVTTSQRFVMQ